jgi:hypothetical protein
MFWILMLIVLKEFSLMLLLIQITKNVIYLHFIYKIDLYILLQYFPAHLKFISISNSKIIILRMWTKPHLNQGTEKVRYYASD